MYLSLSVVFLLDACLVHSGIGPTLQPTAKRALAQEQKEPLQILVYVFSSCHVVLAFLLLVV